MTMKEAMEKLDQERARIKRAERVLVVLQVVIVLALIVALSAVGVAAV